MTDLGTTLDRVGEATPVQCRDAQSRPNPRKTTRRALAVKLDIKAKRMTLSDVVSMVAGERVRTG